MSMCWIPLSLHQALGICIWIALFIGVCPNFNFQFHNFFAVRDSQMNKRWKNYWLSLLIFIRISHFWKLSEERLAVFVHLYLCSSNNWELRNDSTSQKVMANTEDNWVYLRKIMNFGAKITLLTGYLPEVVLMLGCCVA